MHIVGGIYNEKSIFPARDVIYGSGGRAAAVIRELNLNVSLTSFVGQNRIEDVRHHVKHIWNASLKEHIVPEMVSFTYYHGLSNPIIRPTRLPFPEAPLITVSADIILQFGMLEGRVVVHGDRVIYDPQNPETPELFSLHGSTANELAYVLNRGEAFKLTNTDSIQDAANKLLTEKSVSVVVIKAGADGAHIYTKKEKFHVCAYATENVWPIGSGDVFATVFAHFWGTEKYQPELAAEYASKGAALYCGSRSVPISKELLFSDNFVYPKLKKIKEPSEAKIYLAGPFFTMGQLWLVEEARSALLHAGFNVFSPYHDVGLGSADEVVQADIDGIEDSNVLFALCDGLDAGTLFEVGYAVKKGIPVIAFAEQTTEEAMKMLHGTNCKVFRDFTSAIYHTQWEALK
jgi:nucleoside 2-deoxyribosyltransferase